MRDSKDEFSEICSRLMIAKLTYILAMVRGFMKDISLVLLCLINQLITGEGLGASPCKQRGVHQHGYIGEVHR